MRNLAKDGSTVIIFTYLALLANYIFATLLIRAGATQTYGYFAYLTNLQSLVIIVCGMGLQTSLMRFKEEKVSFAKIASTFHFFVFTLIVTSTLGFFFSSSVPIQSTLGIALIGVATTWLAVLQPIWQWRERLSEFQSLNFKLSVFKLSVAGLFFFLPADSREMALLIAGIGLWVYVAFNARGLGFGLSFREMWRHRSSDMWMSLIAVAIYNRLALLLLPHFGYSASDLGIFAYAYSLFAAFLMLPATIQSILMRPLFKGALAGPHLWGRIHRLYLIAGVCFGVFFSLILPVLVSWIAGLRAELPALLQAFAPSIPLVFIANLLGLGLMSESHDRWRMVIQVISALAHVGLLFLFVPRFGLVGAAQATTVSYMILYLGYVIGSYRYNLWRLRRDLYAFLLFGGILGLALWSPHMIYVGLLALPFFNRLANSVPQPVVDSTEEGI